MDTLFATALLSLAVVGGDRAPSVAAPAPASSQAAGDEPDRSIARAGELVCLGRYADARALYARVARDHPGSAAAVVALRRMAASAFLGACELVRNGPSVNRVDVVLLGDGYELEHLRAFDELAEDVPPLFERQEPFREYWSYFNFMRGSCVSAQSGVDGFGRTYDTALGGFTRKTDAGHVGVDPNEVRKVLDEIPENDGLGIVFAKLGVLGTGTEGIAVVGGRDARTAIHEWGHAFAGLGDEYSTHTHPRGRVISGINVSATEDEELVPWRHWLTARHPSVGIYEGAFGKVRGAWRPIASGCIMNDGEFFCPVCREALVLRIYSIVDPIESAAPEVPTPPIREPVVLHDGPVEFSVRVLRPATHHLEVRWWVQPESSLPETAAEKRSLGHTSGTRGPAVPQPARGDRRARGPLAAIRDAPYSLQRADSDAVHVLRIAKTDLDPGRYRVVCRVRDTTKLRDEAWPWVLRDEQGLLESERVWWLLVK